MSTTDDVAGLVERLRAWRGFLSGAADHGGLWFGDKHPHLPGAFWWRKLALPVVDEAADALQSQAAEIARLMGEIDRKDAALLQGVLWFEEYAGHHADKLAMDKAARNTERAMFLRAALAQQGGDDGQG